MFGHDAAKEPSYPVSTNAFNKPLPGQQATPTAEEAKHLAALEKLDFDAFNNKDWAAFAKVYDKDVITSYSDLHQVKGVDAYLNDLKARFALAADARTTEHLISFASGDWTAKMAITEGSFTEPTKKSGGASVSPNGKPFKIITSNVAHWKDGLIDHQYVFYDSAAVPQQVGIAPAMTGQDYGPEDIKSLFPPVGQAHLIYVIQKRLHAVDEMDFDVFARPHLDRLPETHGDDILVVWPDGHLTRGLERHTKDIEDLFAISPDLLIQEHPVRLGTGEWTAMVGVMNGTFSGSMSNPSGGAPIPPTGKKFKISMATFSHWVNSTMDAEYIIYDTGAFMRQIGVSE